jgi:hypothetical protein
MFTATVGYTDKRNESEHVHEHWWENDTIWCPSPRHEQECYKWSCDSAWLQRLGRQPVFTQSGTRFRNIEKGILSLQTDQSIVQQKRLVKYLSMVLRFMVLLAHAPATMPIVQQLVSHNTRGQLNATQPVFPRPCCCILAFVHVNGYRAPLWCSEAGLRRVRFSTFSDTLSVKDFKLCSSLRLSKCSLMGTSRFKGL